MLNSAHVIEPPASLPAFEPDHGRVVRTIEHRVGRCFESVAIIDYPRDRRMISGIACSGSIVHGSSSFAPMGCELKLLPLPLLFGHGHVNGKAPSRSMAELRIGEIVRLMKTAHGLFADAAIDQTPAGQHAWNLIVKKRVRSFSIAATGLDLAGVADGVKFFSRWDVDEISICEEGADAGAKFNISHDEYGVRWP